MVDAVDAELLLDVQAHVGECPMWWRERASLVWVDPPRRVVHVTDVATLTDREVVLPFEVSAIAPAASGGFIVAVEDGVGRLDLDTGELVRVCTVALDTPGRFNDGACDGAGRFFAGTFAWDLSPGRGVLYRFDSDGNAARVLDGITVSNGMRWSPGGDVFYYVDSMTNTLDAFTYDASLGTLRDRRVFARLPNGGADGVTVDAAGGVWVALWGHGEIHRYRADGRHDRTVRVPTRYVTSCEFGGAALDVLFITSSAVPKGDVACLEPRPAGALFSCRPGVEGLPARVFGT